MTSLYISNKPSALNKDLIRYLDSNLKSIVGMGIYITFFVAGPDDADHYAQQGITNFPTLTHNSSKHVGVDKIKAFFNSQHTNFKKMQAARTEKDDIDDYWNNILSKGDEEEGDPEGCAMTSKAQQAAQERQEKMSQRNPKNNKPGATPQSNRPHQPSARPPQPLEQPAHQATQGNKKTVGSRKSNIEPSTVDVLNGMKGSGEEEMDDKLMAKFFESQMETDM
jgi:hypothetical protein